MKRIYLIIIVFFLGISSVCAQSILKGKTLKTTQDDIELVYTVDGNGNAKLTMSNPEMKLEISGQDLTSSQFFFFDADRNSVNILEVIVKGTIIRRDCMIYSEDAIVTREAYEGRYGKGSWDKGITPIFTQFNREAGRMIPVLKSQIVQIDNDNLVTAENISNTSYKTMNWEFVK